LPITDFITHLGVTSNSSFFGASVLSRGGRAARWAAGDGFCCLHRAGWCSTPLLSVPRIGSGGGWRAQKTQRRYLHVVKTKDIVQY